MAEEKSSPTMITLKTADNILFEVEPHIAKEMKIVQLFIDETKHNNVPIPLPNVYSSHLSLIINYSKKHFKKQGEEQETDDAKQKFDEEFVKKLSKDDTFELVQAANYLDFRKLLEFLIETIANHISDKDVEYVRDYFSVENDYTLEEEAALRKENSWAFQDLDQQ